jgi:thioredoxin 1
MVEQVTASNFKEKISQGWSIVDFWAEWCGPCKQLAPIFEELSGEYTGKLNFFKLDTEQFGELAGEHNVRGIPCLIVFQEGVEKDRIVGFMPKESLKEKIDAALQK